MLMGRKLDLKHKLKMYIIFATVHILLFQHLENLLNPKTRPPKFYESSNKISKIF